MTSTESDSSEIYRSNKSNIKRKTKSEKKKKNKKSKRKKHHKYSRSSSDSNDDSNSTKQIIQKIETPSIDNNITVDSFGPALPPHLLKIQNVPTAVNSIIGPVLPSSFQKATENFNLDKADIEKIDDNNSGIYGPMPIETDKPMSVAQRELEQRALELKLAAIEGNEGTKTIDQKVREEWMLELPDVGLKTGLAALSNMKRTFHQGKEKPDFGDRSVWTKTPQTVDNPTTSKDSTKIMQESARAKYDRLRDEEQELIARKHKKRNKRDESLVELHQKKLRKEQKKKEKELAATGAKLERRPFSRDVDLKLNKIDKNQTKSIVDKAKILNSKFSSGHTKYL